jgi:LAS superfamily LD-carboxypeptidase LdcB
LISQSLASFNVEADVEAELWHLAYVAEQMPMSMLMTAAIKTAERQ